MTSSRSLDATDARLALGAEGLLATFNAAGVITSADVHVATNLGRLGGEPDQTVLLAIALTARAVRAGSICLDLATVADLPVERAAPLARARRPGRARSPPARWSASACCTGSTGCSTSTATTSRRPRSSTT